MSLPPDTYERFFYVRTMFIKFSAQLRIASEGLRMARYSTTKLIGTGCEVARLQDKVAELRWRKSTKGIPGSANSIICMAANPPSLRIIHAQRFHRELTRKIANCFVLKLENFAKTSRTTPLEPKFAVAS